MCGIFGWIKPKTHFDTALDLATLFEQGLINSLERGEDATGFYSPTLGLVKDAIDAEEFVEKGRIPAGICNERFVIGHVRMASAKYANDKANLLNPKNAQPFESKNFVTVHNGTINVPRIKGYTYESDIDSESIIAYAETTSLKNALASISGGAAVVAYDKRRKCMYFWTNGDRPINVCLYKGMIFFASTKKILQATLKPKTEMGIFSPEIAFATVYENELLEYDLTKNKFTRKGEIKAKVSAEAKAAVQNQIVPSYFKPVTSFSAPKPLPRGCTSNPPSPPKQGELFQDDVVETVNKKNTVREVHVGTNGVKVITYRVKKDGV